MDTKNSGTICSLNVGKQRGGVIGQTRAVKNYFLSFECVNFKFILVGPIKDVRKFCLQSGGGVLGYQ